MTDLRNELRMMVDALGWPIRVTKRGFVVYPPNGSRPIPIHSGKPTSRRTIANYRAQFRRAGADI